MRALSKLVGPFLGLTLLATSALAQTEVKKDYAEVNGLKMYYEIHGAGKPLVLLHGAFGTTENFSHLLAALTAKRQVILIEVHGHGRTADIDRPLRYRQLADDVAGVLTQLKIKDAEIFGYSMGGVIATGVAIKHPELVSKVAMLGSDLFSLDKSYEPEMAAAIKSITPENFDFPEVKDPYTKVAPDPSKWPVLVKKLIDMFTNFDGYSEAELKSIKAKTLIMAGDREGLVFDSVIKWYQTIPQAQLAIYPNADHFYLFTHSDQVTKTLFEFLDQEETEETNQN